jgi:hypothetical protein
MVGTRSSGTKALSIALAAFLALLVTFTQVLPTAAQAAPPAPDVINLEDVAAFQDLLETDDLLVVAYYRIAYTTIPDDQAGINYLVQLKDSSSSLLGTNTPYAYNDSGYGYGVVSVYLTAAEVTAASLGAWPYSGLTFTLQGNPSVFATVPSDVHTLISGDYSTGEGNATNKTQLAAWVLQYAASLEETWQLSMLTDSGLLNASRGTPYFIQAIPGLRNMVDTIFSVSSESPVVPTPAPTPGGPGTLSGDSATRFDGTFWLTPAFNGTGTTLGLPNGAFQGIIIFIMMVVFAWGGQRIGGGRGAFTGAAIALACVPVAMVLGLVSWAYGVLALAVLAVAGLAKVGGALE